MAARTFGILLVGPLLLLAIATVLLLFDRKIEQDLSSAQVQIKELRESADTIMSRVAPSPDSERLKESFIALGNAAYVMNASVSELFKLIYQFLFILGCGQIVALVWIYRSLKPNPALNTDAERPQRAG